MKRVFIKSVSAIVLFIVLCTFYGCKKEIDTTKAEPTTFMNGNAGGFETIPNTSDVIFTESIKSESTVVTETSVIEENFVSVDTEFYTLSVPFEWYDKCGYEEDTNEYIRHSLSFYHKDSRNAGYDGFLFCISLLNPSDDYAHIPEHDVLGALLVDEPGGGFSKFNIIVRYPSDVRFSEETIRDYKEQEAMISEILKTIEYKEKCTFLNEPIAIETEPIVTAPIISKNFVGVWSDMRIGSPAPLGATSWNVEFRSNGTGSFVLEFEPGDIEVLEFDYYCYDTYYGNTFDGVVIEMEGSSDLRYMMTYTWSNELQKMMMTMYEVEYGGAPNLDVCWVFSPVY
ncbi:MAG: hypothetical protein IJZ54_07365 [Clostridia bacterium]|nr:hypothetical protein [Clostridia bacterium]